MPIRWGLKEMIDWDGRNAFLFMRIARPQYLGEFSKPKMDEKHEVMGDFPVARSLRQLSLR
jgi:hypothetical protein